MRTLLPFTLIVVLSRIHAIIAGGGYSYPVPSIPFHYPFHRVNVVQSGWSQSHNSFQPKPRERQQTRNSDLELELKKERERLRKVEERIRERERALNREIVDQLEVEMDRKDDRGRDAERLDDIQNAVKDTIRTGTIRPSIRDKEQRPAKRRRPTSTYDDEDYRRRQPGRIGGSSSSRFSERSGRPAEDGDGGSSGRRSESSFSSTGSRPDSDRNGLLGGSRGRLGFEEVVEYSSASRERGTLGGGGGGRAGSSRSSIQISEYIDASGELVNVARKVTRRIIEELDDDGNVVSRKVVVIET